WAELTGEDTSSGGITGSYKWKMVMPQDGSFVDHSSGYTSGDSYTAIEANGVTGLASGTVVQVWFAGFLAGGEPFYVFVAGRAGESRAVWVKITGDRTGGGKYDGVLMEHDAALDTDDLALPEDATEGEACIVFNRHEDGASTHILSEDTYWA